MNNMDDKNNEYDKKIVYLNNKIFEEKMKIYAEKISKSDYVYYEGRVQNIKDFEKGMKSDKDKEYDNSVEVKNSKEIKTNYTNSYRTSKLKKFILKVISIFAILYISPFIINSFTDCGMNGFISFILIAPIVYYFIMSIVIM